MFVVSYTLNAIAVVLHMLISAYIFVVLAACVISWFRVSPYHPAVQALNYLTNPAFRFIRYKLPFSRLGQVDLSPLILIIALELFDLIVVRSIQHVAMGL